jgi:hypothetical protein
LEGDFLANNFEDSLESQAVILLARADGAGEFCDATTRVNAGSIFPHLCRSKIPQAAGCGAAASALAADIDLLER